MDEVLKVGELMLPLEEYAVVPARSTLGEAIRVLQASQENVPDGRQPHRSVIVQDDTGRILGKMGYYEFLQALLPHKSEVFEREQLLRASGITEEMMNTSLEVLQMLQSTMEELAARASTLRMTDVMLQAPEYIEESRTLSEAILQFLEYRAVSLLVTRRGQAVGILRLSDVFDKMAGLVAGRGES
ncbi:CBS domain-containing protein [bacterium]|nr:CBS domain-containing protein [bacterium]